MRHLRATRVYCQALDLSNHRLQSSWQCRLGGHQRLIDSLAKHGAYTTVKKVCNILTNSFHYLTPQKYISPNAL